MVIDHRVYGQGLNKRHRVRNYNFEKVNICDNLLNMKYTRVRIVISLYSE